PFDDGDAVLLRRSVEETAAFLGPEDARAYRLLVGPLAADWLAVEPMLLSPLPLDLRAVARLLRALGVRGAGCAVRAALSTAVTLAERSFAGARARGFFAGNAAHSMLQLEQRPSAGFGLALLTLGHAVGWPFPRGGSQAIADALAAKLLEHGGKV